MSRDTAAQTIHILVPRRCLRRIARALSEPPDHGVPAAPPPKQPPPRPAPYPPPRPKKGVGETAGDPYAKFRPRTRGDCLTGGVNAERPCPWASCRYSLLVDVNCDTMEVRETAENPEDLPATCSLDVARQVDESDRTSVLRKLEPYFGLTREHVRKLELRAIRSFAEGMSMSGLDAETVEVLCSPWGKGSPGKKTGVSGEEE